MAVFAYTDSQAAEISRRLLGSRRVVAFAQGTAPRAGDAIGTLGAYFLWPQLSDTVGRKPVISLSLLGSGIGLALQCLSLSRGMSLNFFLGCKVFTGLCAGASPVAKAYLADLGSNSGNLPRYANTLTR